MSSTLPPIRSEIYGSQGAVACVDPLASLAAVRMLMAGGNAVDAAVAAAAVLNVLEPNHSGLGGIGWMLIYHRASGHVYCLDSNGPLPRRFDPGGETRGRIPDGAKSVCVPGQLAGWAAALERFGRRELGAVLEPAIAYAEAGFPVSSYLSAELREREGTWPSTTTATWLPEGRAPSPSQILKVPGLAHTLRAIARQGPRVLYGGEIGRKVVEFIQSEGGYLTLDDLADYEPEWTEPFRVAAFGHEVYTSSLPTRALLTLIALRLAERIGVTHFSVRSAEHIHLMCECYKLASRTDARIYDPGFGHEDAQQTLEDAHIETLAEQISRIEASPDPLIKRQPESTTYVATADHEGNVVSFTTTIGSWGCGLVAADTGILLLNVTNYVDLDHVEPGVRTRGRSPAPVIVRGAEGDVVAIGTPGGNGVPQTTLQVLVGVLGHGRNLQEAIDLPRWRLFSNMDEAAHVRRWATDGDLLLESRLGFPLNEELQKLGYKVRFLPALSFLVGSFSAAGGDISREVFRAADDLRRGGCALAW